MEVQALDLVHDGLNRVGDPQSGRGAAVGQSGQGHGHHAVVALAQQASYGVPRPSPHPGTRYQHKGRSLADICHESHLSVHAARLVGSKVNEHSF